MPKKPSKYRSVEEQVADRKAEREAQAAKKKAKRKAKNKAKTAAASRRWWKTKKGREYNRRNQAKRREEAEEARRILLENETPEEKRVREEQEAKILAEQKAERQANIVRQELARRELCRRRLIAFTTRFNPNYLAGWVHKDICARLEKFVEDVIAGKRPRLMLQMPPRHGKSQLASIELPAWFLGNHPDKEVICCSYASDLALDFSRAVRERLRNPEYQVIFEDTNLDKDNQNAQGWKTTKKGGFLPAGVGGPITGKGADILIIDDPIKNSEEAESETHREGVWKWYTTTAYTRLAPGAGVLVIQTRWHDDDLSGRLERNMLLGKGDEFEVVRYPATAVENELYRNKGDALHPERFNKDALAAIELAVGPRTWAALYQQNPVPDDGAYFRNDMFKFYDPDNMPEDLVFATAWDLAIGQKEANDWTVGLTWGHSYTDEYYVVDMQRGRWDSFEIVDEICDGFVRHSQVAIGIEKSLISQSIGPLLEQEIARRRLFGLPLVELPTGKRDKVARARTVQGLLRQGRVYFPDPAKAPWVARLMEEMLRFPYGKHDDIVDALAWLGLMVDETPMPGPVASRLPARKGWRDRLKKLASATRKTSAMSA